MALSVVLVPYLPLTVSSRDYALFKSLAGLLFFYSVMVFMIYAKSVWLHNRSIVSTNAKY